MNEENVIDLLKQDHQELKMVMENVEKFLNDTNELKERFQAFKKTYSAHDTAETEIFYEALKEFPSVQLLVRKGYQAHHVVDMGMLELRLVPYTSESWGPKFLVIKDSILMHMTEEETKLFPQAEALLTPERLIQLSEEIRSSRGTSV